MKNMHSSRQGKKYVASLFVFLSVLLPAHQAQAGAWGEAYAATLMKDALEQIRKSIDGVILGAVKAAAISSVINQVDRLLGGVGAASPRYIRNYDDFLREQPGIEAQAIVHNFLIKTYRGKSSTANYTGAEGATAHEGSHATRVEQAARNALERNEEAYDLDEYCRNVRDPLREGDWRCQDAYWSNPLNNQTGAALRAESEYEAIREELRYQRQIMATSDGFLPAFDRNGRVITPSGTIGAVVNDARTLATKVIAAAENPQELVSGVVFALVNRGINTLATKAAGLVEDAVDKTVGKAVDEIIKVSGDVGKVLRTVDGYILTADGYVTEANYQNQQLNNLRQNANRTTPAPPSPLPRCTPGAPGCIY
jgi:hypothetical protein